MDKKEKIIKERYGSYILTIRYFLDGKGASVKMEDLAELRFPLLWSETMTVEKANACLDFFKSVGYFSIA